MSYDNVKEQFIKLKKEELKYIDEIASISRSKLFTEYEKIEIYRVLKKYEIEINEILNKLWEKIEKNKIHSRKKELVLDFDIDRSLLDNENVKKIIFNELGIDLDSFKFELKIEDLLRYFRGNKYKTINFEEITNNQKLFESPIYVFLGYYDSSEDCYGPLFGDFDNYLYGVYLDLNSIYEDRIEIPKKKMMEFEKDKIIIYSKKYISFYDIKQIFKEELLNTKNNTVNDCIINTQTKINELSYLRSPEYKEKLLLDKINELYKKVNGEFIKKDILYSDSFFNIIKETYKLANGNTIEQEKVIRSDKKNNVIVIAIDKDKKYIISFQNKNNAEFISGKIENNMDVIEASKKILYEKTGYISDDLFIVEELTNYENINSITYVIVANSCTKIEENVNNIINFDLFNENELEYLIHNNIFDALNKLVYYSFVHNIEDCNYICGDKRIYKKLRKN